LVLVAMADLVFHKHCQRKVLIQHFQQSRQLAAELVEINLRLAVTPMLQAAMAVRAVAELLVITVRRCPLAVLAQPIKGMQVVLLTRLPTGAVAVAVVLVQLVVTVTLQRQVLAVQVLQLQSQVHQLLMVAVVAVVDTNLALAVLAVQVAVVLVKVAEIPTMVQAETLVLLTQVAAVAVAVVTVMVAERIHTTQAATAVQVLLFFAIQTTEQSPLAQV
jgi:hypothetical protein